MLWSTGANRWVKTHPFSSYLFQWTTEVMCLGFLNSNTCMIKLSMGLFSDIVEQVLLKCSEAPGEECCVNYYWLFLLGAAPFRQQRTSLSAISMLLGFLFPGQFLLGAVIHFPLPILRCVDLSAVAHFTGCFKADHTQGAFFCFLLSPVLPFHPVLSGRDPLFFRFAWIIVLPPRSVDSHCSYVSCMIIHSWKFTLVTI